MPQDSRMPVDELITPLLDEIEQTQVANEEEYVFTPASLTEEERADFGLPTDSPNGVTLSPGTVTDEEFIANRPRKTRKNRSSTNLRPRMQRTVSIYAGDDSKFRKKLKVDFGTALGNMESLDYDVVDNRVFRERGRHKSSVAKWLITLFIGVGIGFLAFTVEYCLQLLIETRLHILGSVGLTSGVYGNVAAYILCGIAFAVFSGVLTIFVAPAATGAGVALVMTNLNGLNVPHLLDFKTLVVKVVGVIFSVPSGLPIGPEGPLVHIGAAVSSWFTKQHSFKIAIGSWTLCKLETASGVLDLFHNDHDRRDFLSSGAAAGLAAAFGAPIGGVLFSLEEASSFWNQSTTWRSVFCTSMATFVLTTLHGGIFTLGPPGLIQLGVKAESFDMLEVVFFAIEAAFFGLLGAAFNHVFKVLNKLRPKKKVWKILEIVTVVLLCNLLSLMPFFFPSYLGTCVTPPEEAYEEDHIISKTLQLNCPEGQLNDMAMLMLGPREHSIKLLMEQESGHALYTAGSLTLCGTILLLTLLLACDLTLPAGLFMPQIFIGATFGSLWGLGFHQFRLLLQLPDMFTPISPGLYALVGATAMLAGTFRSAISLVVIMLEGTGNVQYLLPLLVAVSVSKSIADLFNKSIYDMQIHIKRIPFLHGTLGIPVGGGPDHEPPLTAKDIMTPNVIMFEQQPLVANVEQALRTTHNGFPVVRTKIQATGEIRHYVKGLVTRQQLLTLLSRREFISEEEVETLNEQEFPEITGTTEHDSVLDKAMRTFFHRHTFYNRNAMVGEGMLERMGLTDQDRNQFLNLTPFMNIAPLTVQLECSSWKVFNYFRTMGLRHVPVVDERNCVKGIITRKDFCALEAH